MIQTPLAAIGITICYDGGFPELYRAEAIMGAEVIVRPTRCCARSKSGNSPTARAPTIITSTWCRAMPSAPTPEATTISATA
ncbi:nitrilase-related carbon-nitrogen hydrolase [Candidatus Amarolinea dominans]|uniref:nitrilase-related carbon-nitrogen hydrolase n=1 Tax=Candidatus Amarolinea dominans TaxID=3140696 RepID=UPI0031CC42F0